MEGRSKWLDMYAPTRAQVFRDDYWLVCQQSSGNL